MKRRSFLGALASLPLLAGFKSQTIDEENEKYYQATPITRDVPEKQMVDRMTMHKMVCGDSGVIMQGNLSFYGCSCSGTF